MSHDFSHMLSFKIISYFDKSVSVIKYIEPKNDEGNKKDKRKNCRKPEQNSKDP